MPLPPPDLPRRVRVGLVVAAALAASACRREAIRAREDAGAIVTTEQVRGCVAGSLLYGSQARVVPEVWDGKVTGWRFTGAGPGLAQAGVLKGDVLVEVDGAPIPAALYQCLDGATLKLRRRGAEVIVHYPEASQSIVTGARR